VKYETRDSKEQYESEIKTRKLTEYFFGTNRITGRKQFKNPEIWKKSKKRRKK
jgi:hypothetical protein